MDETLSRIPVSEQAFDFDDTDDRDVDDDDEDGDDDNGYSIDWAGFFFKSSKGYIHHALPLAPVYKPSRLPSLLGYFPSPGARSPVAACSAPTPPQYQASFEGLGL